MNKAFTFLAILMVVGAIGCGAGSTAPLQISTSQIAEPVLGQAFTFQFQASGGNAPYTWAVTSGSLPPGFTLSPGGMLSGKATTSGSWNFTVQVADSTSTTSGGK